MIPFNRAGNRFRLALTHHLPMLAGVVERDLGPAFLCQREVHRVSARYTRLPSTSFASLSVLALVNSARCWTSGQVTQRAV